MSIEALPMREIVLALMLLGTTAHAWDDRLPVAPPVVPLVEQRGFDRQQVVPVPEAAAGCETRGNIFGSVTIDCGSDRPKVVCRPNVFEGITCD